MFWPKPLEVLFVLALVPLLVGATPPRCEQLLEMAGAELQREQYPTMLTLAQERQLLCPGPESSFLAGVARANMLDKLLVPPAERPLVREQALSALRDAGGALRAEWRQTALTWISYLEALPPDEAGAEDETPPSSPELTAAAEVGSPASTPRAAPPWEPDVYPWGPVLLGGAGLLTASAGLVTYFIALHMDSEIDGAERACMSPCRYTPDSRHQLIQDRSTASTLFTISDVALIAGGATAAGALLWYAFRHTPSDPPPAISMAPWVGGSVTGAQVTGRF